MDPSNAINVFLTFLAKHELAEPFGIGGVVIYLGSYFALQIGLIRGQGYLYPSLNVVAAIFVIFSLTTDFNLAAALIQVSFIIISLVGLARNWLGRLFLNLTDVERRLLASKFPELRGHRARRLMNAGTWKNVGAGSRLTVEGEASRAVTFLAKGSVDVFSEGQRLYRYGPNILIGEISCMSSAPSTATTIVAEDALVFSINCERLRRLVARDAEMRLCIEASFSRDTRKKIIEKNSAFRQVLEKANCWDQSQKQCQVEEHATDVARLKLRIA